jgi:hypothetical protein
MQGREEIRAFTRSYGAWRGLLHVLPLGLFYQFGAGLEALGVVPFEGPGIMLVAGMALISGLSWYEGRRYGVVTMHRAPISPRGAWAVVTVMAGSLAAVVFLGRLGLLHHLGLILGSGALVAIGTRVSDSRARWAPPAGAWTLLVAALLARAPDTTLGVLHVSVAVLAGAACWLERRDIARQWQHVRA